jgi:hypothetical protein
MLNKTKKLALLIDGASLYVCTYAPGVSKTVLNSVEPKGNFASSKSNAIRHLQFGIFANIF